MAKTNQPSNYEQALQRGEHDGYVLDTIYSDRMGYKPMSSKAIELKLARALNELYDEIESGKFIQKFPDD